MATKCFCDRCGLPEATRTVYSIATEAQCANSHMTKLDKDLCPKCRERLTKAIVIVLDEFGGARGDAT